MRSGGASEEGACTPGPCPAWYFVGGRNDRVSASANREQFLHRHLLDEPFVSAGEPRDFVGWAACFSGRAIVLGRLTVFPVGVPRYFVACANSKTPASQACPVAAAGHSAVVGRRAAVLADGDGAGGRITADASGNRLLADEPLPAVRDSVVPGRGAVAVFAVESRLTG